ncbi:uncharacterized protein LOC106636995 [Copidosoma floridanum]|uniref:uncharacterized protein LOC106636995 n=1 Tax=Copidosoma floridanum TaxID=29053 RepID=UPI0006C9AE06|nr:uncharacterized protein LOC106636995 [Copidosoma floridanum]
MAEAGRPQSVRGVVSFADADPRRNERRSLAARASVYALILGGLACVLQTAAAGTPTWAYFHNPDASTTAERGYFGPWRQCKLLLYGRERCGQGITRFKPIWTVRVAGFASAGAAVLMFFVVGLAILQLAMASSAKRVVMSYSTAITGKVALATLATCLAVVAAVLFAMQTDDRDNSFVITRGEGFWMQVMSIVVNFGVFISAVYEGIYARRGGDPTKLRSYSDNRGATINNPGYRESRNGNSISMTDASGKPYASGTSGNGSMASVATSGSAVSTASPLRSSLKKPKPLGIQNPGFATNSPTLQRNGSQKKVRIQTHSTEV